MEPCSHCLLCRPTPVEPCSHCLLCRPTPVEPCSHCLPHKLNPAEPCSQHLHCKPTPAEPYPLGSSLSLSLPSHTTGTLAAAQLGAEQAVPQVLATLHAGTITLSGSRHRTSPISPTQPLSSHHTHIILLSCSTHYQLVGLPAMCSDNSDDVHTEGSLCNSCQSTGTIQLSLCPIKQHHSFHPS